MKYFYIIIYNIFTHGILNITKYILDNILSMPCFTVL